MAPVPMDSTIVYSAQGTKAVFPFTSRCDLYKKKRAGQEDAFMLPRGTVERLRGRPAAFCTVDLCSIPTTLSSLRANLKEEGNGPESAF